MLYLGQIRIGLHGSKPRLIILNGPKLAREGGGGGGGVVNLV